MATARSLVMANEAMRPGDTALLPAMSHYKGMVLLVITAWM